MQCVDLIRVCLAERSPPQHKLAPPAHHAAPLLPCVAFYSLGNIQVDNRELLAVITRPYMRSPEFVDLLIGSLYTWSMSAFRPIRRPAGRSRALPAPGCPLGGRDSITAGVAPQVGVSASGTSRGSSVVLIIMGGFFGGAVLCLLCTPSPGVSVKKAIT